MKMIDDQDPELKVLLLVSYKTERKIYFESTLKHRKNCMAFVILMRTKMQSKLP